MFPGQTDGTHWMTKEGKKVLLTEMEDTHLANAIGMTQLSVTARLEALKHLRAEADRRKLAQAEEAKKTRRTSALSENRGRFIREED